MTVAAEFGGASRPHAGGTSPEKVLAPVLSAFWDAPESWTLETYLRHDGYRIIEGPLPVPSEPDHRLFRVELQLGQCNRIQPIEVVQARRGGWFVANVRLDSPNNLSTSCRPRGTAP